MQAIGNLWASKSGKSTKDAERRIADDLSKMAQTGA
jgi:hypothetical protein